MKILLKNMNLITSDTAQMYIKGANIGIEDGYISFIGASGESKSGFVPDRIIDGANKLAMPGLVNTHTHCAMTLLRNFANDLALQEWLFNRVFPAEAKLTDEAVYWGTLLGIAEMIKTGTTAFADMYLHMGMVANAVAQSGIRANLSISPLKFNAGEKHETIDETPLCNEFYNKWNSYDNGRIKVFIEVHSAYLFNTAQLKEAAQLAKSLNTGIQIHILETELEREETIKTYGVDSAEICYKCGIFDVPVVAAHCVYLSDDDIELFGERQVNVSHNPSSNLKLGSGIARVPYLLERGINVSIGTDGAASNNNLNMFEEMHIAALLHKGINRDPSVVSAGQAIRMATVNGAKAIGFGSETGCIKEGMKADIIILDIEKPHLCPVNDPLAAVVYSAQGSDVDTVIVDGKILMENRELKTLDEEKIIYKVRKLSEGLLGIS